MKKVLLFTLAAGMSISAIAQQAQTSKNVYAKVPLKSVLQSENKAVQTTATPKAFVNNQKNNPTNLLPITCVTLGQSGNAYGSAFGAKTALYANNALNTVVLTRRSDLAIDPATGYLRADYSTNGGASFTLQGGPLYSDPGNVYRARYPQGVIYNPTGNTNPSNAYISYYAPATDGTNWIGQVHGTGMISSLATSTSTQATFTAYAGPNANGLIPDNMCITQQGVIWNIGIGAVANVYNDTLILSRGTFSGSDFTYTRTKIYWPVSLGNIAATGVAFSADGQTGYVAALCHNDFVFEADSVYYPVVIKTTDGGTTWGTQMKIQLDALEADLLVGGAGSYTTAFELDMEVDNNGELHMLIEVGPGYPDIATGWSIGTTPGFFGMFDIYSRVNAAPPGICWYAELLYKPETFRGTWGTVAEDARGQISTNLAHDKLVFVFFDTDTITFGSTNGNFNPDVRMIGASIASPTLINWSAVTNATTGTCADGVATFGLVSPYSFESGTTLTVPISVQQILTDELNPCDHVYLPGATISTTTMTIAGTPEQLFSVPSCPTSIDEMDNDLFTVTSNYPNPFSGTTAFDINLVKPATVSVEIVNVVGASVIPASAKEFGTGTHTITIDATKLSSGVYFYTVRAGEFSVTKKMVVK